MFNEMKPSSTTTHHPVDPAVINAQDSKLTPIHRVTANEALRELEALFTKPHRSIGEFINIIALGGARALLRPDVQVLPVFRTSNTSGFNYSFETKMLAYVRFGVTTSGYFVVQNLLLKETASWQSHYYAADGAYAFSESGPISHHFASHKELLMEARCPVLNHIYNILAADYLEATEGLANTKRAHTLELCLKMLDKTRRCELSVSRGAKDEAIVSLNAKMMKLELDPIYTWKERFRIYKGMKAERSLIIQTKRRAHRKTLLTYTLPIFFYDVAAAAHRFFLRPWNNLLGTLDHVLFDPIRWFFGVVKGNMGYSIALAIYSPFTFFFITQPMNPHATWAAGKVRSAYIESTERLKSLFTHDSVAVSTTASQAAAGVGAASVVNGVANASSDNALNATSPATRGILLSTDVKSVNEQSWDDRMSNFKAMQMAYESNLEIAPRFGRLEQMETQLNWPLHMEAAWMETERYLNFLNYLESQGKDYQPAFMDYVKAEKMRTEQTELYLWDRNARFILDHPFTMMDQSGEQTQLDYYVGRAFVLLRDMTNTLAFRNKGLQMPAGYDSIAKLAQRFDADYKKDGGILDRLKLNSKLFAQKNPQDTDELRSYMRRQWEILYLLQNRAQEGSNNGLQLYIWSVRNAVFLIQSLYSAKHEDLSVMSLNFKKGAVVNKVSMNFTTKQIESQYEALYHMMVLEYASVRKEIGENLRNDIEAKQRKTLISGVESFFKEREALLKGANLL